mmetsp:Transcript_37227/g.68102  ORF Transcript_37227/g.68102 Transcript_37227/m.68102 type:complete len:189 (-) Transcript_37227:164-730(-)
MLFFVDDSGNLFHARLSAFLFAFYFIVCVRVLLYSLQLEQLFSVSAMGSSAATGKKVERQPWLRCLALGRLLAFLGADPSTSKSLGGLGGGSKSLGGGLGGGGQQLSSGEKCTCGFVLAASAPWQRSPVEHPPRRFDSAAPEFVQQNFVGRDEVFGEDPRLVCDVWRVVQRKAVKFAYRPWGTTRCFL